MNEKVFVPPIKIQGIKTKLVPFIKQNIVMDDDSVWIEPFMGSGVVGFNVEPNKAIFADTNPHIINFYNQIKSGIITPHIAKSFLECEGKQLEKGDSEYYYTVRNRFNLEHDPLDFLFLNRSCFNGMIRFNKNYMFNVPYGHKPYRFDKSYVTKIVNQIAHIERLIHRHSWTFLCQSFEKTITMAKETDFIYCDPPYIGRNVDYYDRWDDQLERALHDLLYKSKAKFMLSTWDHTDYRSNEYLQSIWFDCEKTTHDHFYFIGAKEVNRKTVVEALLTNYHPSATRNEFVLMSDQMNLFDSVASL